MMGILPLSEPGKLYSLLILELLDNLQWLLQSIGDLPLRK
jgi:hypothetical protein